MKRLFTILILTLLISCNNERPEPNYYRNQFTGELLNKAEFQEFQTSFYLNYKDSIEKPKIIWKFFKLDKSADSIIQNFKYDMRIGDKYIVRAQDYKKIGMKIPVQNFKSIDGEEITIGGKQDKPTLINLWFIQCPGCIAEMPALNRLKEKYSEKVNFVALTFEKEEDVRKFLKKREFEFNHIVNVEPFIKEIASYPYPENIFIDKNGTITSIEGPLPSHLDTDVNVAIEYFERIIIKLL
ncbi:TlpA family protein disulfide reductase [Winogradskyella undariae]|uniref:TlpA family protein disulfide reductase n=1 Tax=Winogradskyella undariae TaxID=1285465 RepID=UPI00156ABE99|nr:TlpA disulfide reductase family protein [Winogradskyella undariae]NRR93562.1 TlpA family protein disulfide reductase [Winogradskyella undariae]